MRASDARRHPVTQQLGARVRRHVRAALGSSPPLVDGPLDAFGRRAEHAAFACPLDRVVLPIGLRFSAWNPLVLTAEAMVASPNATYVGSTLERFYQTVQPRSAGEALFGLDDPPAALASEPPVAAFCTPWERLGPERMVRKVAEWVRDDHRERGIHDLDLASGFNYFGPTDRRVGEIEAERIRHLVGSLRQRGYDRRHGDVLVEVLRRGDEVLFISNGGGVHRSAAAAALGFTWLPARPVRQLIDVDDAEDWPNVRSGLWTVRQARHFVDHLFDFDYRAWAHGLGLASRVGGTDGAAGVGNGAGGR